MSAEVAADVWQEFDAFARRGLRAFWHMGEALCRIRTASPRSFVDGLTRRGISTSAAYRWIKLHESYDVDALDKFASMRSALGALAPAPAEALPVGDPVAAAEVSPARESAPLPRALLPVVADIAAAHHDGAALAMLLDTAGLPAEPDTLDVIAADRAADVAAAVEALRPGGLLICHAPAVEHDDGGLTSDLADDAETLCGLGMVPVAVRFAVPASMLWAWRKAPLGHAGPLC